MMGTVRLLPLMAFAALCLLVLKTAGLVFSGGYVLTGHAPLAAQEAPKAEPAQNAADAQTANENNNAAAENKNGPPAAQAGKPAKRSALNMPQPAADLSSAEGNILESLAKRRKQLKADEQKLRLKENLLKAAEKQVAKRIAELKAIEKRINASIKKRDEDEAAQLGRLVAMYSKMKPKSAAKIFNRLDIKILKDIVKQMKTNKMAAILAAMNPTRAELLTLDIAKQSRQHEAGLKELPKIQSGGPNP